MFFATYSSTNSFVGVAGQSYPYGAPWLLLAPIIVGFCVLAAALVIFSSFFYLTAVFKGVGTTLAAFLKVGYGPAIWIFFLIVVTYTAVGGFISVVKTDVVQGLVMVVAAFLLFGGTVKAAGGLGAIAAVRAAPETQGLFSWDAAMAFPVLLGIIVATTIKLMVEPRQLSRFYALKDQRAVRDGFWVASRRWTAFCW